MLMGFYLGPYLTVKVPVVEKPVNEYWCLKCDVRRGHTKFCQDCGSEVSLKSIITANEPKFHWTIPATCVLRYAATVGNVYKDKEVLYVYTIGNGKTDFNEHQEDENRLKKFWHSAAGRWHRSEAIDLSNSDSEKDIKFLKHRCAAEIENICEVFGELNVSFGWGIVH